MARRDTPGPYYSCCGVSWVFGQCGTRARNALAVPEINPFFVGPVGGLTESRGRTGPQGVVV